MGTTAADGIDGRDVRGATVPDGAFLHPSREHHLDAVRAFLMLLGIPFHATHPFRDDGQSWIVVSADRSLALTHLMDFLHLFRMQGFFLIAGYFTAMLLMKRDVGAYLESRLIRLVPPLVTGLLVIVPLMNLAAALQNSQDSATAVAFWAHETFTPGRSTTGHLWFVIVLIYFTCASAALSLLPKVRTCRLDMPEGLASRIFLPVVLGAGLGIGLYEAALPKAASFLPALLKHPLSLGFALEFAPYFAIGAVLNRVPAMNDRFNRFSWPIAVAATCAGLIAVGVDDLPKYIRPILKGVAAVGMTQSIISGARLVFNVESRWVRELVEASFVVYLLHLPIIIATFGLIDAMPVHYMARYLMLAAVALVLSFGGWALVRRSAWLLFFMSGVRIRRAASRS